VNKASTSASKNSQQKTTADSLLKPGKQVHQSVFDYSLEGVTPGFISTSTGFDLTQIPARPGLTTGMRLQRRIKNGYSSAELTDKSEKNEDETSAGEEQTEQPIADNNVIEQSAAAETASAEQSAMEETPSQLSSAETVSSEQSPASEEALSQQSIAETLSPEQSPVAEETSAQLNHVDASSAEQSSADETSSQEGLEEQSTAGLLVEDSVNNLGEGQMRKSEFLQRLRTQICRTIEPVVAKVGQTTKECPYLNYWLDLYQEKDAAHIERTAKKYAPDVNGAKTADDYISIIAQRALRAAEIWATTGKLSGLPEGVPTTIPTDASPQKDYKTKQGNTIQAKARVGGVKKADDPLAIKNELGNGQPLAADVRSRMESAFGMSFSHVRTHTDSRATELSDNVNARAFTVGNHVAFGNNEYKPGTLLGDALIAHELAHTIQQGGAEHSVDKMEVGTAGYDALEKDADNVAVGVLTSLWSGTKERGKGIQRKALSSLRSGLQIQRCNKTEEQQKPKEQKQPEQPVQKPPVASFVIKSKTKSTIPADRARLKLGIGEEVECSIDPPGAATWSLTGDGSLSSPTGPTTTFTASQSPSTPVIKADFGGQSATITFDVIAPNGMTSSVKSNEVLGTPGPPNNQIGSKTIFDCVVKPDTVSFYNASFRENIPKDDWTWPDGSAGTNGPKIVPWNVTFDNKTTDTVTSALRPIRKIHDGTKFVDFGYTIHVPEDYQDKGGNWVTWLAGEEHLKQFRGADQKGKSTLIATNTLGGDWSGPWQ
jgi:hypothetical protein